MKALSPEISQELVKKILNCLSGEITTSFKAAEEKTVKSNDLQNVNHLHTSDLIGCTITQFSTASHETKKKMLPNKNSLVYEEKLKKNIDIQGNEQENVCSFSP